MERLFTTTGAKLPGKIEVKTVGRVTGPTRLRIEGSMTSNNRDKIEEIKNRLDIVDVIKRDIDLHKIGGDEYAGTVGEAGSSGESLKVSQKQQTWYDFKNKQGGDVYDWIGNINGFDARGADFPKVLKIAADLAGVELEGVTEQERDAAKEKADIHNLLTEAAEIYHKNITPELYDYIEKKWGIKQETVNKLKIGYATTGRNLKDLDKTNLKKSGLVYVNNGLISGEVFKGRITFPYWKNGKVVYLIGRETEETPEAERQKGMKYKKLLVHKEGHEYVSPSLQNSYFYGEDSLRGSDYCIITEGVADCIAMLQAGFPCISPVTVQFREKDHQKLISLTRGLKPVYICNDNETNKTGLKGALNTAEALESEGIEARIIKLPKPEGVDKIDIAEYMKDHTPDDFEGLKKSSVNLWECKLNEAEIPQNSSDIDRLKTYRIFISEDLKGMQQDMWEIFVYGDVRERFGFKSKSAVKTTVIEVIEERKNCKEETGSEGHDLSVLFDLNKVTGRNLAYRHFADLYVKNHNVKCINGKLRVYKDGIYPESDENIDFIKTEIMKLGLEYGVTFADNNLTAIIKVIENSTRLRIEDCEPNKDNVIVVNNGILNMETWELEEFSPGKVYFSKLTVDYDPNAPKPEMFMRFIDMAFKDNPEQALLLQELTGYTLVKNHKYQAYFYLLGSGGEGKGTYLDVLRYMLGEDNVSAASIFQLSDHPNLDYHVIELFGKHANICGDAGCKKIDNTETLKKLTSNTDPVRGRRVRERPIEFVNHAKIIVALNKLPVTNAFTLGDRRRCIIINFNNKIKLGTKEEIKAYGELIRNKGELPGILNWGIEGLKRLEEQQGFTDSRSLADKTLEYEKKSRPIRYFIEECLEEDQGNIVPNEFVYERLSRFTQKSKSAELSPDEIKQEILNECKEAGWTVTNKLFRVSSLPMPLRRTLESLGIKKNSLRCFTGIKLVDEPTPIQFKIVESDCLEKKGLVIDVIKFKENHSVYKHLIADKKEFAVDMNSWYPDYPIEGIMAVVEKLQKNGWKYDVATTA